jgi:hypothetical protein
MELASEQSINLDIYHLSTPAVGLLKMFENQLHTDVTFQVSGQVVCAHRIVLASQSDYFDCLLFGPMKEGRATEITLKETPAEAFRELLKFLYSGSVKSVNVTTALDLHILADRYGFTFLKDEIEAHLITIISVDNVLLFHSHAHVSSAIQLKERCETFMDQNAKSVIKSRSLPCLPKENFKVLIARATFVVEEVAIFDAVKKWIEHNKVDKNDAVDLLECVRLTEIPYGELKSRVLPSGLYQREAVTEAMRGSQVSDRECIATRGKTGENLNLFQESGSKLLTCTNYLLDIVPEKGDNWSCVSDFLFSLACPANNNPACITVKFDDMYIVNQVTFDGYADRSCTRNAENERTPFCYQVWVSTDGNQWITILDYSRLKCYARQRLFFAKMAIRYLRILQTRGKEKFTLNLDSCSYVGPVPYRFRHLGLIGTYPLWFMLVWPVYPHNCSLCTDDSGLLPVFATVRE